MIWPSCCSLRLRIANNCLVWYLHHFQSSRNKIRFTDRDHLQTSYGYICHRKKLERECHLLIRLWTCPCNRNPNQPTDLPKWPTWPSYTKGSKSYLAVSSSPGVRSRLKEDRMTVWLQTIPALLKSQGALGLDDTPWSHCYKNPTGSASYTMSVETSIVTCFVMGVTYLFQFIFLSEL